MKNKYLIYLGTLGTLTPLSMLLWVWRVVNVESLAQLLSQSIKFYTFLGGVILSLFFAALTVFFTFKSRTQCTACGANLDKQIIQAEKLSTLGQLAGGVAHEVNTPASIISGRVETMLLNPSNFSERDRSDLEVIQRQADRISQITKGLLLFSRRAPVEKSPTDLNGIVQEALSLIQPQIKNKIEVNFKPFPTSLILKAHPNQLVQVFLNLLTNARDAMPNGGKIEIQSGILEGIRPRAFVKVIDSGIGIASENIHMIFDPFYTSKKNGTGLGLSVSYGIIQDHGGTISVESCEGEGTTFTITVPLVKA